LERCYVWVDYHSVPQLNKHTQALAIKTLPIFAYLASLFVVIAPECVHADTGSQCNFRTYQRRMWCRAEAFSFCCRRGVQDMYIADEKMNKDGSISLSKLGEATVNDTILVFEGECTCCARNHHNMAKCDKETLRDVFIGLYADIYQQHAAQASRTSLRPSSHSRSSSQYVKGEDMIVRISSEKERIFPERFDAPFETVSPSKSRRIVTKTLFGKLIETLENMLQEGGQEVVDAFGQAVLSDEGQDAPPELIGEALVVRTHI